MRTLRIISMLAVLLIVCAQASAQGSSGPPQSTSRLCSGVAANGSATHAQFSFAGDRTMGVWRGDDTVYGNAYQAYHITGGVDGDINLDGYTTGQGAEWANIGVREITDCGAAGISGYAQNCTDSAGTIAAHKQLLSNNGDAYSPIARARTAVTAADLTNATTTFSTVDTMPLSVGTFLCTVLANGTDSTGADGLKWKLNTAGLTVVGTSLIMGTLINTASPAMTDAQVSTTGSSVTVTGAAVASAIARFEATLVVTVAGDLLLQSAQVAHSTGTLTSDAGASIVCQVK